MQQKILIIAGPTASGKSALALKMAQEQGGVIINADAMQLYRELRVLTARPTAEEEAQAPHLLYGVLPAAEASSAGRWLSLAKAAIESVWAEGKLPIMVGGTGLYLKTLQHGIAAIPEVPETVRERVRRYFLPASAGNQEDPYLHQRLQVCDPVLADKLNPGDTQRISRALEVYEATGRPLSDWQKQAPQPPFPHAVFERVVVDIPRTELYRRCDARLLAMMEQGALAEVKRLLSLGLPAHLPAMRAVGVPELASHIRGGIPLEEAVMQAQQATRNYAKRQLTWLRNQQ